MACAAEHATFNLIAVTVAAAVLQHREDQPTDGACIAAGIAASCMPSLPDILEPAVNPNHRQFFHSLTSAVGLGYALHRVYRWEAESDWERIVRVLMLVGGGAYLAHLARDAFTAKSLPLI